MCSGRPLAAQSHSDAEDVFIHVSPWTLSTTKIFTLCVAEKPDGHVVWCLGGCAFVCGCWS